MPTPDFYIKRGDRRPPIEATLSVEGAAVDLTEAGAVRFHMAPEVNGDAEVVDAVTGQVRYSWAAGDTDNAGLFDAEFEIEWADGEIQTVPNDGYIRILVSEDVGA